MIKGSLKQKFFEKMKVDTQNVTEYITGACYDGTIKQKPANSKPSKRMGRKVKGPKVLNHGSPTAKVSTERRTKNEQEVY